MRPIRVEVGRLVEEGFGISRALARHVLLRGVVAIGGKPVFLYAYEKIDIRPGTVIEDLSSGTCIRFEGLR